MCYIFDCLIGQAPEISHPSSQPPPPRPQAALSNFLVSRASERSQSSRIPCHSSVHTHGVSTLIGLQSPLISEVTNGNANGVQNLKFLIGSCRSRGIFPLKPQTCRILGSTNSSVFSVSMSHRGKDRQRTFMDGSVSEKMGVNGILEISVKAGRRWGWWSGWLARGCVRHADTTPPRYTSSLY